MVPAELITYTSLRFAMPLTRSYDGLDRLANESTPQGSVGYAYDNADRLTGITQGASSVNFSYDNARRRSTLPRANGIVLTYAYDNANRLTGITYAQGASTLGYDANGRRTGIGGSYAQADLLAAISTTTYNGANQLAKWGSAPIGMKSCGWPPRSSRAR